MILREKKNKQQQQQQCFLFKIFLQFPLPTLHDVEIRKKKSGNMHTTLFVEWGEGLGISKLKKKSPTNAKVS